MCVSFNMHHFVVLTDFIYYALTIPTLYEHKICMSVILSTTEIRHTENMYFEVIFYQFFLKLSSYLVMYDPGQQTDSNVIVTHDDIMFVQLMCTAELCTYTH
jgi:hypothetical protein